VLHSIGAHVSEGRSRLGVIGRDHLGINFVGNDHSCAIDTK
jgi:hypothetical protein